MYRHRYKVPICRQYIDTRKEVDMANSLTLPPLFSPQVLSEYVEIPTDAMALGGDGPGLCESRPHGPLPAPERQSMAGLSAPRDNGGDLGGGLRRCDSDCRRRPVGRRSRGDGGARTAPLSKEKCPGAVTAAPRRRQNQRLERLEMSELILSSVELVEHYLPEVRGVSAPRGAVRG